MPETTSQYTLFIGEMLIDFIPAPVGPNQVISYQPHPGGAVANAAVALARLGGQARFLGKLSEDSFGRLLMQTLAENRVDTHCIPTTRQGNTTLVLITLQADGQREFTFYRHQTADTLLEATELVPQIWEQVAICHSGSVLLASEPARSAVITAMGQARQRHITVSFDVNVRPVLWKSEAEMRGILSRVIPRIDLLKCSAEEIHYLDPGSQSPLNESDTDGLSRVGKQLLEQGPALVVITRGARGVLLLTRERTLSLPASPCQAVDTTGAGDAFSGAFLAKLLQTGRTTRAELAALPEQILSEAGEFATKAASISCTRYGGIYSLPYLGEVGQTEADMERD